MAIITKLEFDRLVDVSQLQTLGDNSYLKDENDENFKWIRQQFFYGDKNDTKLFNVGSGLFGNIQSVLTNFVGNPNVGKEFDIAERVNDYVATGYCAFVLYRENGKLQVRREPAESVSYEDGVYRIIKIYVKDVTKNDSKLVGVATLKNTYVLVQEYQIGKIINKLYEVRGLYQITTGTAITEVPLTTIFETSHLAEEEETKETFLTIFLIKEKDDLLSKMKGCFRKIKNMVYSVDRRIVMFDNQFLNNVESFILLKNIVLPKKTIEQYNDGKKVNFKQLGRILTANEDGGIEFINNQNDLIDKAIEYEKTQVKRIGAITTIPIDFLGLDTTLGAIGEGSRSIMHGAFIKTIEQIRDRFVAGLTPILDILSKENGSEYKNEIIRGDVFARSGKDLADELKVARDTRLISNLKAIQQYLGVDEEQAKKELALIDEEGKQAVEDAKKAMGGDGSGEPDTSKMTPEEIQKMNDEKKKQGGQ